MTTQLETDRRRPNQVNDKLTGNTERVLWIAHCRAAQLLDDEPGPFTRTIFDCVHAIWQRAFLDLQS